MNNTAKQNANPLCYISIYLFFNFKLNLLFFAISKTVRWAKQFQETFMAISLRLCSTGSQALFFMAPSCLTKIMHVNHKNIGKTLQIIHMQNNVTRTTIITIRVNIIIHNDNQNKFTTTTRPNPCTINVNVIHSSYYTLSTNIIIIMYPTERDTFIPPKHKLHYLQIHSFKLTHLKNPILWTTPKYFISIL